MAIDVRFNPIELPHQDRVWAFAEDQQGLLWVASDSSLLVYDGYEFKPMASIFPNSDLKKVRKLVVDRFGVLWIGTRDNGLYRAADNQISPVILPNAKKVTAILADENGIWVAANEFLFFIDSDGELSETKLPALENSVKAVNANAIVSLSEDELLVATQYHLYGFNKSSRTFTKKTIVGLNDIYINDLYIDQNQKVWLATDIGVYLNDHTNDDSFLPFLSADINFRINTVVADEHDIWFGSVRNGLVKVNKNNLSLTKFKHRIADQNSIAGDTVIAMTLDDEGVLVTSSFHGGLSKLNTQSLAFGLVSQSLYEMGCSDSPRVHGIYSNDTNALWLSTVSGLIELEPNFGSCIKHDVNDLGDDVHDPFHPIYSFKDSANTHWITTAKGLNTFNPVNGLIDDSNRSIINAAIYFMLETKEQEFLVGSSDGLYKFSGGEANKIDSSQNVLSASSFYNYASHGDDLYFATDKGVAILSHTDGLKTVKLLPLQIPQKTVFSVFVDEHKNLWVGVDNSGLYKFDKDGQLLNRYDADHGLPSQLTVFSILRSGSDLWMGTNNGLAKLNINTDKAHVFQLNDGLQDEYFISGSAFKGADGKLYFGGRNGFNAFNPDDIKINSKEPEIILTGLTHFGETVRPGIETNGFVIDKPINDLEVLELTHNDYVIGFKFAALSKADSMRNQYAFKMEGQDPDWNFVNAENRNISYSNLAPGEYTFKVKGTNKDGTWNESGKSLSIRVKPAPWLSWWAYTLYILLALVILLTYLNKKNRANKVITERLRVEVDKKTSALQTEKKKVETLLLRKNEMFANVSHEFRTPLTLILGPINKLLHSPLPKDNIQSLEMVNRNAHRLLTMIEQLLQLAKMSSEQDIAFIPQQVHANLENLVASFQILAEQKNITLSLKHNDEAAINGTKDLIDIVIGNLISNAIKFTQIGGTVTATASRNDQFLDIEVTDNGCGLDAQQQVDIFNRFTRLESHHNIAGAGIGLSVVKEMLKLNNGQIKVVSEPGKGSTFIVRFETIEFNDESRKVESNKTLIDQLLRESYSANTQNSGVQEYGNEANESVLIIDDNADMLIHVAETLKHQYHCITADLGKLGVAEAIKRVPDIVICDVMMPEMDGFQVSRILRSDTRTSHIPLVLLTALNDKKSRIKGWRENIDVYLTKPFDADELIVQLENILVIRNILKKKASTALKSGKMSINSGLPKKDQQFVKKLIEIIEEKYMDSQFLRPEMASMMAVSERQLQRKIKALIDKNPLDILREYRLERAAVSLKDGYQVSLTADNCGFNSVTYFSKCFKQRYGVSPKVYQQNCHQPPKES